MKILQPPGWRRPKGYSNGIAADGRLVVTGGLIGWDANEEIVSDDFVEQFRQVLRNITAVLAEAGARPEHLVRLTWYVTDKQEYLARAADVGAAYRDILGRVYPAMAVVQVAALMEDRARIEIEATAVVPRE
ncbi:RidA family protein [Novispirillum sp. DQ9]|uniref:RidA family protein n=1 Tax=Novispirillum sp. DQ9 TaxID=3398612 RepID=UPI003C7E217A